MNKYVIRDSRGNTIAEIEADYIDLFGDVVMFHKRETEGISTNSIVIGMTSVNNTVIEKNYLKV